MILYSNFSNIMFFQKQQLLNQSPCNLEKNKFDSFFFLLSQFFLHFPYLSLWQRNYCFPYLALHPVVSTIFIYDKRFPFVKIRNILKEFPVFQNKHLNPNYTRIRETGENGGWQWGGDLISQCSPFFGTIFLQKKICGNQ